MLLLTETLREQVAKSAGQKILSGELCGRAAQQTSAPLPLSLLRRGVSGTEALEVIYVFYSKVLVLIYLYFSKLALKPTELNQEITYKLLGKNSPNQP